MAYKAYVGSYSEPDVVLKICEDIKQKDSTFRYKIIQPFGKLKNKYKCILVITDEVLQDVQKRAGWFVHKCNDADFASYFWTKKARDCKERKEAHRIFKRLKAGLSKREALTEEELQLLRTYYPRHQW